jgi:hypothetical protein
MAKSGKQNHNPGHDVKSSGTRVNTAHSKFPPGKFVQQDAEWITAVAPPPPRDPNTALQDAILHVQALTERARDIATVQQSNADRLLGTQEEGDSKNAGAPTPTGLVYRLRSEIYALESALGELGAQVARLNDV